MLRVVAVEEASPTEQNAFGDGDLDIGGIDGLDVPPPPRGVGSRRVRSHRYHRRAGILQTGGDQAKSRRRCVRLW